jgi:hypothetical protein
MRSWKKRVENVIRNNCMSISQLGRLTELISYELDKLKLCRLAVNHITDPANKKDLQKYFRFESSHRALEDFFSHPESTAEIDGGCKAASSDHEIDSLRKRLASLPNDNEKLAFLKKTYQRFCFYLAQTAGLLSVFVHDREKLEAAKILYYQNTEQSKYAELSSVFSYNQTAVDFKQFVLTRQK